MEEYRGKYRKTTSKSQYTSGGKKKSKGFLAGLFKQTIWSAVILGVAVFISSSSNPAAKNAAQYVKSAITYKPDRDWAVDSINTFFGKNENADSAEDAVTASTEDKNAEVLE